MEGGLVMDIAKIEAVLAAYGLRGASRHGKTGAPRRYEVWSRGRAVSGPLSHNEAVVTMRRLIAKEIIALAGGGHA